MTVSVRVVKEIRGLFIANDHPKGKLEFLRLMVVKINRIFFKPKLIWLKIILGSFLASQNVVLEMISPMIPKPQK